LSTIFIKIKKKILLDIDNVWDGGKILESSDEKESLPFFFFEGEERHTGKI